MPKRNKDKDQYIKFIAVIDIIMKYSDEKHHMTINDIKEKLYELENDFQIDFRAIKKYVTFYNEYYEEETDYVALKHKYNQYMLEREDEIKEHLKEAKNIKDYIKFYI